METTAKPFRPLAGQAPAAEVEFGRAMPLLNIVACLSFTLLITWSTMQQITRFAPRLLPQRLAGLGYAQDIQGRIDSAVAQRNQGLVPQDQPICAIVGFSGGQEGIDLDQLAEQDELDIRYLGLCGACDGTIAGLSGLVAPFHGSSLTVDSVVMAINPFHLVARPFVPSLQRSHMKHAADKRLLSARRRILRLLGVETDPRYLEVDPWRSMTKRYYGIMSDQLMEFRLEQYRRRGYCDIKNYDADKRQGAELRKLIKATQDRDARVVIVLMPVHPQLFYRLPSEATTKLRSIVDDMDVDILDYQQAISAPGFYDVSHLNGKGRDLFTSILADDLSGIFE